MSENTVLQLIPDAKRALRVGPHLFDSYKLDHGDPDLPKEGEDPTTYNEWLTGLESYVLENAYQPDWENLLSQSSMADDEEVKAKIEKRNKAIPWFLKEMEPKTKAILSSGVAYERLERAPREQTVARIPTEIATDFVRSQQSSIYRVGTEKDWYVLQPNLRLAHSDPDELKELLRIYITNMVIPALQKEKHPENIKDTKELSQWRNQKLRQIEYLKTWGALRDTWNFVAQAQEFIPKPLDPSQEQVLDTAEGVVMTPLGPWNLKSRAYLLPNQWDAERRCNHSLALCTMQTGLLPKQGDFSEWQQFLLDRFEGDWDTYNYAMDAFASALLGKNLNKNIYFLQGEGDTAKTTTMEVIRRLLGSYSKITEARNFTNINEGNHSQWMARLKGSRFVHVEEAPEGSKVVLSVDTIKKLTGGGTINARGLGKEDEEFSTNFTVFWDINTTIEFPSSDGAMWNRIRMIPFSGVIQEKDKRSDWASYIFKKEGEAILWELLRRAQKVIYEGVTESQKARQAKERYKKKLDSVGAWMLEKTYSIEDDCGLSIDSSDMVESSGDLWKSYNDWCDENRMNNRETQTKFYLLLKQFPHLSKGRENTVTGNKLTAYRGIKLISPLERTVQFR